MQARGGAGRAHDGSTRTMIGGPIEHQLQWVLDHPGVLGDPSCWSGRYTYQTCCASDGH